MAVQCMSMAGWYSRYTSSSCTYLLQLAGQTCCLVLQVMLLTLECSAGIDAASRANAGGQNLSSDCSDHKSPVQHCSAVHPACYRLFRHQSCHQLV